VREYVKNYENRLRESELVTEGYCGQQGYCGGGKRNQKKSIKKVK
jgi:hypothetical protein